MDDLDELTLKEACRQRENATARLKRATELLREWRDKYGGREHYGFANDTGQRTACQTDLAIETRHFLEGR